MFTVSTTGLLPVHIDLLLLTPPSHQGSGRRASIKYEWAVERSPRGDTSVLLYNFIKFHSKLGTQYLVYWCDNHAVLLEQPLHKHIIMSDVRDPIQMVVTLWCVLIHGEAPCNKQAVYWAKRGTVWSLWWHNIINCKRFITDGCNSVVCVDTWGSTMQQTSCLLS